MSELRRIIIIGRGNAAISFHATLLSELQKLSQCKVEIFYITRESFCIRPELFFKYKFLLNESKWQSTDRTESDSFGAEIIYGDVKNLNVEQKNITYECFTTQKTKSLDYDICILAVGGIPNWINFKENLLYDIEPFHGKFNFDISKLSHYAQKLMKSYQNMTVLRNTEEIDMLEDWIQNMIRVVNSNQSSLESSIISSSEIIELNNNNAIKNQESIHKFKDREIVVVGSGALALDFISNLLHGYLNRDSKHELTQVPKITLISRSNSLGMSLFGDEKMSDHIKNLISKNPISDYVSVLYEEEIIALNIVQNENGKTIDSIDTRSGKNIKTLVLVQAIGVSPNIHLSKESGLTIGKKNGLKVNDKFECESIIYSIPKHTLFAIGDAIEFPQQIPSILENNDIFINEESTAIWKNWTSSREQGEYCAKYSILPLLQNQDLISSTKLLTFSQTLRLFELYVCCHGLYKINEEFEADYYVDTNDLSIVKLNYFPLIQTDGSTLYQLVGVLILGNKSQYFQIGNNLLQIIKWNCRFSNKVREQLASNVEKFNYSHCIKIGNMNAVFDELIPDPVAKKFVNPLLRKKKINSKKDLNKQESKNFEANDSKLNSLSTQMNDLSI